MTQQTSTHVVESFCGCGVPYCALLVTFTPQVILLNSVKRPKLIDLSRSPMHHRDTSTGHACPLGTPMCRLEACGSRWGAVTRGTLYALQTSLHGRVCREAYGTILAMYLTDASRSMKYVNGWLHEPYYLTTCVPDGGLLCQQQM